MVETIFRVLVIVILITVVISIIGSIAVDYELSFTKFKFLFTVFLTYVVYIVPFNKLLPIFTISIAVTVFKIAIAIGTKLWDLLPMSG